MSHARLVAVLGYSNGRAPGLHAVCAARLARAAEVATAEDAVLLSGSSHRRRPGEADLMERAWAGAARELVLDSEAGSTYGNALAVARAVRRLGVSEVVLVTSGWHGRRATTLVRAAVRGSGSEVRLAATDERGRLRDHARELACWALVPVQRARASRTR